MEQLPRIPSSYWLPRHTGHQASAQPGLKASCRRDATILRLEKLSFVQSVNAKRIEHKTNTVREHRVLVDS